MESSGYKKPRRYKRHKIKIQEKLIKKFPYRLSWLTEPSPDTPKSWKAKSKGSWKAKSKGSQKDQLPLQKKLVPTRSIPLPGQDLSKLPPLKASADQPYTSGASGPSESFS